MEKMKVYVGCALLHAPEDFKQQIRDFKKELRSISWIEVLEFVDLPGEKDPLHIYTNDIHDCVGTARAIVGELSFPSTGLGYELGVAIEKHRIRTFMCAKQGTSVSFLPRGSALHQNNSHATFSQYSDSILELLPYFINELSGIYHAEEIEK